MNIYVEINVRSETKVSFVNIIARKIHLKVKQKYFDRWILIEMPMRIYLCGTQFPGNVTQTLHLTWPLTEASDCHHPVLWLVCRDVNDPDNCQFAHQLLNKTW